MAFTKALLSGSNNGKQIKVTGTDSAGAVTVHTAVAGTSDLDEIWIYAYNHDTTERDLTLQWGGTTSPDDLMVVPVRPKSGRLLVCDGKLLQNGLLVKAFAEAANVIMLDGFVNKIAP